MEKIGCAIMAILLIVFAGFAFSDLYSEAPVLFWIIIAGAVACGIWPIAYGRGEKSGEQKAQATATMKAKKEVAELNETLAGRETFVSTEESKLESMRRNVDQQMAQRVKSTDDQIALRMANAEKKIAIMRNGVQHLKNETLQAYPWLADLYADYVSMYDDSLATQLKNKNHPAYKSAEIVAAISREKRELIRQNKMLEYQLHYYETVFPWLEDFKEIDPKEAYKIASATDDSVDTDPALSQHFLSPDEYARLSNQQKYQLALDRYVSRKKSNWEIGVEYERYIGYLYEEKGYKVKYQGAISGVHDLGRDIIASKGSEVYIIQCKRWSKDKTIREKHVFQLFGSKVSWEIENKGKKATGILCTTTELSDVAKKYADYLGIVNRILKIERYPLIKCNISNTGEKIYHLPFDQQYDNLFVTTAKGDRYVSTTAEAEKLGFRRAFRWKGIK